MNSSWMSSEVSNEDYPVEKLWLLKDLIVFFTFVIPFSPFMLIFLSQSLSGDAEAKKALTGHLIISASFFLVFIIHLLERIFFKYRLTKDFLIIRQGIISKRERTIPYSSIQNIYLKRGVLDRLLGITSLEIENASFGGGKGGYKNENEKRDTKIGTISNRAIIPGLKKENAEILKAAFLDKVKKSSYINPLG